MAGFCGKWALYHSENLEAFHDALHTPEEHKAKLRTVGAEVKTNPGAYVEEIKVDKAAGTIHRAVIFKGERKRELDGQLGKEMDTQAVDGRPCKMKCTLESDTKITRWEKGADFETTAVMELCGDELCITQTCGGVVSKQKFKRA